MQDINLIYKGYTGILGDVFNPIDATIHLSGESGFITVKSGDKQKTLKVVIKNFDYINKYDYIYLLKKDQLNLLKDDGIKHLKESQNMKNSFFTRTRNLMTEILNK